MKCVKWLLLVSWWLNISTFGGMRKSGWASPLGTLVDYRHDNHCQDHVRNDDNPKELTI